LFRWQELSNPVSRAFMITFWIVAAATMFHAAMRTVVPPFFYGMVALTILDNPIPQRQTPKSTG
jgi:hypothetical protein